MQAGEDAKALVRTIRGLSQPAAEGSLAVLRGTVQKYLQMTESYCSRTHSYDEDCKPGTYLDAPYWYSERVNVGLLSAAAWRAGCLSLEEYAAPKRRKRQPSPSVSRTIDAKPAPRRDGRADLYIEAYLNGRQLSDFVIEAKIRWIKMEDGSAKEKIVGGIKDAIAAARRHRKHEAEHKIGALFIVPSYVGGTDVEAKIRATLHLCKNMFGDEALLGWTFPACARRLTLFSNGRRRFYPGVLLALASTAPAAPRPQRRDLD